MSYLGDWQPSMEEDRKPFLADGSVEVVRANLEGAKYTLAVPSYVADAGVHTFADPRTDSRSDSTARFSASNPATTATA